MKLLLHTCCAPCLIYPQEVLTAEGFQVQGFFYNPNIHPFSEYKSRLQAIKELQRESDDNEVIYAEYDFHNFFRNIIDTEKSPKRCRACWYMRLKKTAVFARENSFDYFSTTLLVSPYQDIDLIKEIGDSIASNEGLRFYFQDFRPGFKKAHSEARQRGIYCQKYCGCLYSEKERYASVK